MLVFSAIVPHSPLLLPTIKQNQNKKLASTREALEKLKARFFEAKPDTVIILSPHGDVLPDVFNINFCDTYTGDLKEFGDIVTKPEFSSAPALVDKLQRSLRKAGRPLTLLSCGAIDYGITVPMLMLADPENPPKLLPISQSELDFKSHYEFGEALEDLLADTPERVAVIVACHLSHRLDSDSPSGFSPEGKKFDTTLREALENKNYARLLKLKPEFVEEADQCGFESILILLGILKDIKHTPQVLDYNDVFGVGYLTVEFAL